MRAMSSSGVMPFGLGVDHHRRAVRVIRADEDAVFAAHALEADPDVGLDGFDDVAEVQRAVGVGQRAGDENLRGMQLRSEKGSQV